MGKNTITRKRCQKCNRKLKGYYHYCTCGEKDVVDYGKTIMFWSSVVLVGLIVATFILGSFCSSDDLMLQAIGNAVLGIVGLSCN